MRSRRAVMGVRVSGEVNDLTALLARAAAARNAGDLTTAHGLLDEAVARWPDEPEPHHALGAIHQRRDRLDLAEAEYRRTLALAPRAAGTRRLLGALLLAQGRFAEGFKLFEARHELPAMAKPRLPFPEWRGEAVAGKRLLIWPEQGFGDQIQFARFAPVLQAGGAEVTLVCAPPLARLFAGSLGVRVIAAAGEIQFPDPDYWVMCGSLAGRLGVTPETIPAAPYLTTQSAWPSLGDGLKIGVMAQGNPAHGNDANRSLASEDARRLRALPGRIVDLDPAATGAKDFADTAAILEQLDLVISVDTAVAHLAGAMGKPCWILLPAIEPDWRWLRGRLDSPWYRSARLYRQAPGEGWASIIEQVLADAGAMAV